MSNRFFSLQTSTATRFRILFGTIAAIAAIAGTLCGAQSESEPKKKNTSATSSSETETRSSPKPSDTSDDEEKSKPKPARRKGKKKADTATKKPKKNPTPEPTKAPSKKKAKASEDDEEEAKKPSSDDEEETASSKKKETNVENGDKDDDEKEEAPAPTPKKASTKKSGAKPAKSPTPKPKSKASATSKSKSKSKKKSENKSEPAETPIRIEKAEPAKTPPVADKSKAIAEPASTPKPEPATPQPAISPPISQALPSDITIEKSGLQKEQRLEPPPPTPERRGFWPWSRKATNYRYLTSSNIEAIRRAPVQSGRWKFIIIHNSGTRQGNAKAFDYYHRRIRRMKNGLAYHFVVGNGTSSGNGQIEIGDRWRRQIAGGHVHSDYMNNIGLGICLVGDFNRDQPTRAQLDACEELIRYLRERCGKSDGRTLMVRPHREVNPPRWSTDCPGDAFPYGWLGKLR